jgi:hypothetical protein
MWLFNKKNVEITSNERLKKLEHRLTLIEAEILDIATAQNIIRNKVLKKIQFKNPKEDDENPQDLYKSVLLKE